MAKLQNSQIWQKAQEAERGHWADLWLPEDSPARKALIDNETIKGEFIFQELVEYFRINPKRDWVKLHVLDVGCGALSLIARHKYGQKRAGVEPLRYPTWVYEGYEKQKFKVYDVPFEKLRVNKKFDVIVFYNALQHFADLN